MNILANGEPMAIPSTWQYNILLKLNSTSSVASFINKMKLFLLWIGFSKLYNASAQTVMTSFKGNFVNKLFTSKNERKVSLAFRCFNSPTNLKG